MLKLVAVAAQNDDDAAVCLFADGAVDVITGSMVQHRDSLAVQLGGATAIFHIARLKQHKEAVCSTACVFALTQAMKKHLAHTEIQRRALATLATLAAESSNQTRLVEGGVVPCVVACFQQHRFSIEVMAATCTLCTNLCAGCLKNIEALTQQGVIGELVLVMRRHRHSFEVSIPAVAALRCIIGSAAPRPSKSNFLFGAVDDMDAQDPAQVRRQLALSAGAVLMVQEVLERFGEGSAALRGDAQALLQRIDPNREHWQQATIVRRELAIEWAIEAEIKAEKVLPPPPPPPPPPPTTPKVEVSASGIAQMQDSSGGDGGAPVRQRSLRETREARAAAAALGLPVAAKEAESSTEVVTVKEAPGSSKDDGDYVPYKAESPLKKEETFGSALDQAVYDLYDKGLLTDITLRALQKRDPTNLEEEPEPSHLKAHKVILAARCEYFRNRLCGEEWAGEVTPGPDGDTLMMHDTDPDALGRCLVYIYTARIDVTIEPRETAEFIVLASRFGLEAVVERLTSLVLCDLSPASCVFWLVTAHRAGLEHFKASCMEFLRVNSTAVKESGAFDQLAGGDLGESGTEVLMEVIDIIE